MGQATEAAKKAADQLKKDRAEMEKNNYKHMEELAKEVPTPTVEEMKKVVMGKDYVAPKKVEEKKEEKAVEAKPADAKPGYDTRQMQTSKK